MKKIVLLAFVLVLLSTAVVVRFVRPVVADGTIYIKADGSVEGTDKISTGDNVTYTFTDNIYDEIVVERDSIVVDGVGYIVQGTGAIGTIGVSLLGRSNVTIKNMEIKEFGIGIWFNVSSGNTIYGNNITNNWDGIKFHESSNNTISGNEITNNKYGIWLERSDYNTVDHNMIYDNEMYGIFLNDSTGSTINNNKATKNYVGIGLNEYMSKHNIIHNNTILNSTRFGIWLYRSGTNNFRNNNMTCNLYNFAVWGLSVLSYIQDIDTSNTVDGKPIYYWVNQHSKQVQADAGYVAAVNSKNIVVKNLTLVNNMQGVLFVNTTNSTIENVNATNNYEGIHLAWSCDNTISGNTVMHNGEVGIWLRRSGKNSIIGNTVTDDNFGIVCYDNSGNNTINGNLISNNHFGIETLSLCDGNTIRDNTVISNKENGIAILGFCSYNLVSGNIVSFNVNSGIEIDGGSHYTTIIRNTIKNNKYGITLGVDGSGCFRSIVYHNNIVNNTIQVNIGKTSDDMWDDGYPSGGNYWSDYNGTDSNLDGIGDSSYFIDVNNQDNYPLMGMFSDFPVIHQEETFHVTAICNSTISDFDLVINLETGDHMLWFDVTGPDDTVGFCRIMIPRGLMEGPYTVRVDGEEVPANELPVSNSTHAFLYFTYIHSKHHVVIIPEFPTRILMLLTLIVLTAAIAIHKRRLLKTPIH